MSRARETAARAVRRAYTRDEWERRVASAAVPTSALNSLVMDFLLTEGYAEAAQRFEAESGTAAGAASGSVAARAAVRASVCRGDIADALTAANGLNPELLETRPRLLFTLQRQRLVELIQTGDIQAALTFAQQSVAPLAEEEARPRTVVRR